MYLYHLEKEIKASAHSEARGQSDELGAAIIVSFCLPWGTGHMTELQKHFYTQLNLNTMSHKEL